jgi:hypothetical protein
MRRFIAGIALGLGSLLGLSSPAWAVTGPQTFTLFGGFDEDATIVATGPVSGVGRSVATGEETETDVYPQGSINLRHPETGGSNSFDPRACFGTSTFNGTYSVESGTGSYIGASGSGTYQGQAVFVAERTAQGCSEDEFVFSFFLVRATGTTTLP